MTTRSQKTADPRKPFVVKEDAPDDERAFRVFLISSFASLIALALLAVLGSA